MLLVFEVIIVCAFKNMKMEKQIQDLKHEIEHLRKQLFNKETLLSSLLQENQKNNVYSTTLSKDEVIRYSRQIIMPNFTITGQIDLKNSKVLIVGVGGLGCPVSLYLASAGIGEITIMDYDDVELSNLHRQILHFESDISRPKVDSAYTKLKSINSNIKIIPLKQHVSSSTISDIIHSKKFNVIVDGSDNVATRYLLNDVCVLNGIPLVSGSALQMEGQLTVYNYKNGPCYRCLFPIPPPAQTVTNCGDGGVLGPVPGTIGVLQALETIKIITNSPDVLSGRLLLFDGSNTTFRNIKLRNRNVNCDVCGDNPTIKSLIDYEQFCGSSAHDKVVNISILNQEESINVEDFSNIIKDKDNVVIDVRPELEYKMCKIPNTINIPFTLIEKNKDMSQLEEIVANNNNKNVYVLCRRGNDSQRAISYLKEKFTMCRFTNINGGLHSFSKNVDSNFPIY